MVQSHVSGSSIPGMLYNLGLLLNLRKSNDPADNVFALGCHDCNSKEDILLWERFITPRIRFGVPLEDMVGGDIPGSKVSSQAELQNLSS